MKEKLIKWLKTAPKLSHTIRILAGGYLIYLSYGMFTDPASEINAFVIICGTLFVIIGLFLLITSLIAYNKGFYSDYVDYSAAAEEEEQDNSTE